MTTEIIVPALGESVTTATVGPLAAHVCGDTPHSINQTELVNVVAHIAVGGDHNAAVAKGGSKQRRDRSQ